MPLPLDPDPPTPITLHARQQPERHIQPGAGAAYEGLALPLCVFLRYRYTWQLVVGLAVPTSLHAGTGVWVDTQRTHLPFTSTYWAHPSHTACCNCMLRDAFISLSVSLAVSCGLLG